MIRPRKLLFVITDGGRAHFVEYHGATSSFARLAEMDQMHHIASARVKQRGKESGRTHESSGPGKHLVGASDEVRTVKKAFMAEVARETAKVANQGGFTAVVAAAPARLVGELKRQLTGKIEIASTLGKDLTKVPEHELGHWFQSALFETHEA